MPNPYAIILFDGQCAFCDRSVKWIIQHDPAGKFRFAPRQSPAGQHLLATHGLPPEGVESMVLIEGTKVSTHSTAVLRIAHKLPWPWKAAAAFLLIPRPIRDFFYRGVAARRYKMAGKLTACSIPTPEQRDRLLDQVPA
jgi:predicted DCC family thiol-disulfide oxidoreductase YuxK